MHTSSSLAQTRFHIAAHANDPKLTSADIFCNLNSKEHNAQSALQAGVGFEQKYRDELQESGPNFSRDRRNVFSTLDAYILAGDKGESRGYAKAALFMTVCNSYGLSAGGQATRELCEKADGFPETLLVHAINPFNSYENLNDSLAQFNHAVELANSNQDLRLLSIITESLDNCGKRTTSREECPSFAQMSVHERGSFLLYLDKIMVKARGYETDLERSLSEDHDFAGTPANT